MAVKAILISVLLAKVLSGCMNRSKDNDQRDYGPVTVTYVPVINSDPSDVPYRFVLSGCFGAAKDGETVKANSIAFAVNEKIKTGSICVFQILASAAKQKELEQAGYRWRQFPGLLYQDDTVAISVETDGTRRGFSRDLIEQFDFPETPASGKGGTIAVKMIVPIDSFQSDGVEGRLDCTPLTPYKGALKKLTTTTDGLTDYVLQVAVNKPDSGQTSILYSCGIVRLFRNNKLIAIGATDKTYQARISELTRDQTLPTTVRLVTSFSMETSVDIDPQLKPKN